MTHLEREVLARHTPCRYTNHDEIASALAVVRAELILIHPFREGNGRCARLLALLMGLQAGLPPLDFGGLSGKGRRDYIAGNTCRCGFGLRPDDDYFPRRDSPLFATIWPVVLERPIARSASLEKGCRIPSTAEDVLADTHSASLRIMGSRK